MTTTVPAADNVHDLPAEEFPASFWNGIEQSYRPSGTLDMDPSLDLMSDTAPEVDPITYEVIRYSLLNSNFEHGNLLKRLCVSPVVMIGLDYQTSVLLEDGDLVFLGPNLQYFSNSQSYTVKWLLEHRSTNPGINEDDMFLSSDPYVGAPHQPDVCLSAPVFVDGRLFCWVANVMNHTDVGGTAPGSFCLSATDAWSDPPNFPPIKLVEGGRMREDVEQVFVRQSRLPAMARMDLRAAVSGNEFAKGRVLALVERYGAATVKAVMRRVMDAGEQVFAERLSTIPDGTWSHRAYTEASVPGDRGVYRYQVNVHKRGSRLLVDNQGTDPQAGSINTPLVAFVGAVLCALTQQLTSDLAGAYGGVYRRVDFRPVLGTLNCPSHPAAVSPSGAFTTEININAAAIAVGKMMGSSLDAGVRDAVLGPVHPHCYGVIYAGAHDSGDPFIMINSNGLTGPGAGRPRQDGIDAGGQYWVPEAIIYNVEHVEAQYPVLYLYRRSISGGHAGAGRHRGGPGFVECTIPHRASAVVLNLYSNESFVKGMGMSGGNPNGRAWMRVRRNAGVLARLSHGDVPQDIDALEGTEDQVYFKGIPLSIGEDDVFEWSFPANAGFGDPLTREGAAVQEDIRTGRLNPQQALEVYGVVIRDGALDASATQAARRSALRSRAGQDLPRPDELPITDAEPIGDRLGILAGVYVCTACGQELGSVDKNYKESTLILQRPTNDIAPEFAGDDLEMADQMLFREFLCPGCGIRHDTEIAKVGDPVLWDLRHAG